MGLYSLSLASRHLASAPAAGLECTIWLTTAAACLLFSLFLCSRTRDHLQDMDDINGNTFQRNIFPTHKRENWKNSVLARKRKTRIVRIPLEIVRISKTLLKQNANTLSMCNIEQNRAAQKQKNTQKYGETLNFSPGKESLTPKKFEPACSPLCYISLVANFLRRFKSYLNSEM